MHTKVVDLVVKEHIEFKDLEYTVAIDKLLHMFKASVMNNWTPLGVGRAAESQIKNEVFFVVVSWPAAEQAIVGLGLPKPDLHITLGFNKADIHNVPKGPQTIVDPATLKMH